MLQGDAYYVPISFEGFTIDQASIVEITIGHVVKLWKSDGTGAVEYDADEEIFKFPLTQEETFIFAEDVDTQVRVKFIDDAVIGTRMGAINVTRSLTRTVL